MSKKPIPTLKAVDFFCCAGGVTAGFRSAGIEVLAGIDIEGAYKETYEHNNKGSLFIQADISRLRPEALEKQLSITKNMDDLIFVGCSPCQYYTIMPTIKTDSAKGKLLLEEFRKFVDYFRPGFIFIENVPGIETKEDSPLANFKKFLDDCNYVYDEEVVNAAHYSVPQNRKRYVLMATRVAKKIKIPKGNTKKIKTVREAISSYPIIEAGHKDQTKRKHTAADLHSINRKRLQNTSHNGGTRLEWKDNPELQLKCYTGKDNIFIDVYGRMFWDAPSPTITTKFYSISNGRFAHPEQDRGISLREGAVLQSFPRAYQFISENIGTIAKMIGNAVPPKMAEKMGKALLKCRINGKV